MYKPIVSSFSIYCINYSHDVKPYFFLACPRTRWTALCPTFPLFCDTYGNPGSLRKDNATSYAC